MGCWKQLSWEQQRRRGRGDACVTQGCGVDVGGAAGTPASRRAAAWTWEGPRGRLRHGDLWGGRGRGRGDACVTEVCGVDVGGAVGTPASRRAAGWSPCQLPGACAGSLPSLSAPRPPNALGRGNCQVQCTSSRAPCAHRPGRLVGKHSGATGALPGKKP